MEHFSEKDLTIFKQFEITSADTDMYSRIRLGGFVNLLVQSAIASADSLGFGFRGIRGQNLFWVLSRLTVEIYRPLKWYETVTVETWPKNVEKIIYLRDYFIRDSNGEIIGKATSGWLAIDIATKRVGKVDGVTENYFISLKEKHSIELPPLKLSPVNDGENLEIKSGYYDADLNKHITTTRYIDWMMDTFDLQFHADNYPSAFSINFLKESMPGDTIKLTRSQNEQGQYLFEGYNITRETNAFRALIQF